MQTITGGNNTVNSPGLKQVLTSNTNELLYLPNQGAAVIDSPVKRNYLLCKNHAAGIVAPAAFY